jgi:hypothetical protein
MTLRRLASLLALGVAAGAHAQEAPLSDTALSRKLASPVTDLLTVPVQIDYDHDFGPTSGSNRYLTKVQPVIPFSISENWNVISRTIVPIIHQESVPPGGSETGLGDVTQSFFFAPKKPGSRGLNWGAGPAFLLPTAKDRLGADKWGVGPTLFAYKESEQTVYGILANHIWSFHGNDDRESVNATFLQPYAAYIKGQWSFGANLESTYNWTRKDWSVPLNLFGTYLTRAGNQPIALTAGVRYWVSSAQLDPTGWGIRLAATFPFAR